ncbi:MAG: hypothetical protein JXA41_07855 [Deltaproteobacteria bacterium]|nr:hypothetical protein [Deltaproteobacteria bacterium]
MMISGHKTRSVFDRYNIVSQDDLKEAALKRQKYCEEQVARLQFYMKIPPCPPLKKGGVTDVTMGFCFPLF